MAWKFDLSDPIWTTLECSCCGTLLGPGSLVARDGSGMVMCRSCFADNNETEADE